MTVSDETPAWAEGTPEGRRVIELLWNPSTVPAGGRGPKPKLSLPEVVQAGIRLADAEGLAALSMRKVASELGVGAMSLYTYLPGRSELVELMIDSVYGEQPLPDPQQGWRARVEHRSRQLWLLYRAHPWVLDHNLARLPMGPNVLDSEEALYAAVAAAGVAPRQVPAIANVITWHLVGMARAQISDAEEARHTGVSAEAYYLSRNSFWVTYFDPARYPTMAAIHASGGFDDPENQDFETMLARLLDAIELLVTTRASD
ncbi:MAG TPA: TetR/AcrR family transcriptional regulator [Propionibacteriaceae bacterium]